MPDVYKACERFETLGVPFIKTPTGGSLIVFLPTDHMTMLCTCRQNEGDSIH